MPSILIRILLCLSSYFPLAAICAVQFFFNGKRYAGIAVLAIGTLGLIGITIYLKVARRLNPISLNVQSVSRRDGEAMSYIVSYLLPFIALPTANPANIISLAVFLLALMVLYINSGMIHINPMLNLAGWHVYEATFENGDTAALLSRRRIRRGRDIRIIKMDDDIYLEAKS